MMPPQVRPRAASARAAGKRAFQEGWQAGKTATALQHSRLGPRGWPLSLPSHCWCTCVIVCTSPASADKAGSYEEDGEGGSITTFATRRRRLAAAANGTIAAWIYGDNLADSGTGTVLNKDEVHFTAK